MYYKVKKSAGDGQKARMVTMIEQHSTWVGARLAASKLGKKKYEILKLDW